MEDIEKPLIKNILLKNYIEVILNKENITKKDLGEVKEIVLNSENILGEYNKVYIEEISLFPNLEEITIKNLGSKYKNLNEISVCDNDVDKIEKSLKELKNRKIKIMLNGIYEYKE